MRDCGGQMAYRRIMEEARRLFHSYLSDPPEDLWERAYTLGRLNGMAEAAERAIGLDAAPDGPLEEELLAGTIGQAAAAELSGFLREWRHLPSVESVLSDPEEAPVPADPASLYALCEALALRTAPATMEALAAYAGRLPAEFGVLLMRDAVRQDPAVVESEPFARWARDNAEVLM